VSGIAGRDRIPRACGMEFSGALEHAKSGIFRFFAAKEKFRPVRNYRRTGYQYAVKVILILQGAGIVENIPQKIQSRMRSYSANHPDEYRFIRFVYHN